MVRSSIVVASSCAKGRGRANGGREVRTGDRDTRETEAIRSCSSDFGIATLPLLYTNNPLLGLGMAANTVPEDQLIELLVHLHVRQGQSLPFNQSSPHVFVMISENQTRGGS